jgi:hypothetical protein
MRISHFWAMVLFALLVSVSMACIGHRTLIQRVKYAAWSFAAYIAIGVGIAWLMYPFSH